MAAYSAATHFSLHTTGETKGTFQPNRVVGVLVLITWAMCESLAPALVRMQKGCLFDEHTQRKTRTTMYGVKPPIKFTFPVLYE